MQDGDTFNCHRGPFPLSPTQTMTIVEHTGVVIQDEQCRVLSYKELGEEHPDYANIKIVEGIGLTDFGLLPEMHFYLMDGGYKYATLLHVSDQWGNIIFNPANLGQSGVGTAMADCTTSDSPIYDTMGRRVEKLLPGSVYIRNGKKFVAK